MEEITDKIRTNIIIAILLVLLIIFIITYYICCANSKLHVKIWNELLTKLQYYQHFNWRKKIRRSSHLDILYTEEEAVELAQKMKNVTILRTNEGKVYLSSPKRHAEVLFMENTTSINDITGLWIKKSPCSICAQKLKNYFKGYTKPDIFVGEIYRKHNQEDDKQLISLIKQGFNVQVWESLCKLDSKASSLDTQNYLLRLRRKAA